MPYGFLEGQPLWGVYLALLGIVFVRAQATYWLGRGIGAGLHRSRYAERLGPRLERGERLVGRYGPPAVTLSFLTWGVQTAVNLTAGAMRMRFVRYLVAMFLGCLIWAAVYTFVGSAVFTLWWQVFLRFPYVAVGVVVLAVAAVLAIHRWRRRGSSRDSTPEEERIPS